MYEQHTAGYYAKEQRFKNKFPLSIVATLAVIQMLTTFAIFSLEVGHNVLHMKLTNLFVGFWTAVPFTILWISMFAVVCCCRQRSCATHAVIQNIFGLIFAFILIGFDIIFIREPNKCFFSEGICQTLAWTSYISDPIECLVDGVSDGCGNTRVSFILGQLVAGILMAVTCLIYLIIYCLIHIRAASAYPYQLATPAEAVMAPLYSSSQKILPMTISHHHQSCSLSSNPYQGSVPVMMTVYPPQAPPLPSDINYLTHLTSSQYAPKYPQLTNERF
ncbi:unnamed protein product [Rotaria socialis]|uniref:Uncharacterized protein n=1 Tax=Rotaria socialis TaxID=392032 RepID=A0A818EKI3_9BILA|nr:unnamed protein product [Rotaria socialis]CAF3436082.1 unnamed protein product [Rotaria socialis]CAF3460021.1 unnamed protein product [Rotaria socialis]CAF3584873.1 unnamed protein product [Rotaria socialis]CAF3618172.1 unnamed protein product [Rotaria socialis]